MVKILKVCKLLLNFSSLNLNIIYLEYTTFVYDFTETVQLEPIIIFLTDGDPTVGETDPTRIINHLTEKNSGKNKATIFSLAFGKLVFAFYAILYSFMQLWYNFIEDSFIYK